MAYAIEDIMFFKTLEYGAVFLETPLTPYDQQLFVETISNMITQAGSETDFREMLWEHSGIYSIDINELSGIVETVNGYHIILRLPINFDLVPISAAMDGDNRTLRHFAAFQLFEPVLLEWRGSLPILFTDEFESIDFATLFAWSEG